MTLDCGSRPARRKTMRIAPRRCSTPSFAGIPSNERCAVLLSAVALLGIVLGLPGAAQAAPTVSSHTTVLVPTGGGLVNLDRKSTRLNSSHGYISYAVFCLK